MTTIPEMVNAIGAVHIIIIYIYIYIYSFRYLTSRLKDALSKKQKSLHFYDYQGKWKCQGPPKTVILDSGATNLFKLIQEKCNTIFVSLQSEP